MHRRFEYFKVIAFSCAMATMLGGCATSPEGRKQLDLVSTETVNRIGASDFEKLKLARPLSTDPAENAYVTCIVGSLTSSMHPPQKWDVAVFENDEPNAFAFAGGKIGVNSGIFRVAVNSDQLAFVIGHEIGHVIAHHGRERMSQQMAVDTVESLSYLPYLSDFRVLLAVGQYGVLYPLSQTQESEADVIGLNLVAQSGFVPKEAIQFWRNMDVYGSMGSNHFLSGHASTDSRIANVERHLPAAEEVALSVHSRPACKAPGASVRLSAAEKPAPANADTVVEDVATTAPVDDRLTLRGALLGVKFGHSVWNTAVGSVVGFGAGHALQGHYLEDGWKWTLIDAGLIYGIVTSQECTSRSWTNFVDKTIVVRKQTDCVNTPTTTLALIGLLGSHVWQGIELWRQPKKLLKMARDPVKSGIYFQQPLLAASNDTISIGAIWNW